MPKPSRAVRNLETWWETYHEVKAYQAKHNHFPPTKGNKLGIWLNNQRAKARRGLSPKQLEALCAIGADPDQPLPRHPRQQPAPSAAPRG